jgi:hypothetical protein
MASAIREYKAAISIFEKNGDTEYSFYKSAVVNKRKLRSRLGGIGSSASDAFI